MPQMAPLNWLTLALLFTMTLTTYTVINFYSLVKTPEIKFNKNKTSINWKW